MAWLDKEVKNLFSYLEKEKLNPIIIISSNHGPIINYKQYSKLFINKSYLEYKSDINKIPFLIIDNIHSAKFLNTYSQIDIYPTILNMLNINYKNILGMDMTDKKEHYAVMFDSIANNEVFYDLQSNKYLTLKNTKQLDEKELNNLKNIFLYYKNISYLKPNIDFKIQFF